MTQPLSPALGRPTAISFIRICNAGEAPGDVRLAIPGTMEPRNFPRYWAFPEFPVTAGVVISTDSRASTCRQPSASEYHGISVTMASPRRKRRNCSAGLLNMDEIAEESGRSSQTRFDPQRRAETEQALYQQIPSLLGSPLTQSEIIGGGPHREDRAEAYAGGCRIQSALAPYCRGSNSKFGRHSLNCRAHYPANSW